VSSLTEPTVPSSRDDILVVGAGATGGFFGALLAGHGRDVTFLVRPPRAAALRQHGLRVTGPGRDDVIKPQVVTAADLPGPFGLVLLSVKATGLAAALDDLAPAVGPDTAIVPFLNGLDHVRALNERFGPVRVLGGAIVVAATMDADGTIVQLAPGASLTIGEQEGPPSARTERLARLLSGAGFTVEVSPDIVSAMWAKWGLHRLGRGADLPDARHDRRDRRRARRRGPRPGHPRRGRLRRRRRGTPAASPQARRRRRPPHPAGLTDDLLPLP